MMDDWDMLSLPKTDGPVEEASEALDYAATPEVLSAIAVLAPELVAAQRDLEALKAKVKNLTEDIAHYTPEIAGEVTLATGNYVITVRRNERYEWDSKVLAAIYAAGDDFPEHVKLKLTVEKRVYDRLEPAEKAALASALTIKLSAPTVEVRTHV